MMIWAWILGLEAAVAETCAGVARISVTEVGWVPETPRAGEAAYVRVVGSYSTAELLPVSYCSISLPNCDIPLGTATPFPCFYGLVQSSTHFSLQTGAIVLPVTTPPNNYNTTLVLLGDDYSVLACIPAPLAVTQRVDTDACAAGGLFLTVQTWIPINPRVSNAAYLILDGRNDGEVSVNVFQCRLTLMLGVDVGNLEKDLSCYVGEVTPGSEFRVQTDALWIPNDIPAGNYSTAIAAYTITGEQVACWRGIITLEE